MWDSGVQHGMIMYDSFQSPTSETASWLVIPALETLHATCDKFILVCLQNWCAHMAVARLLSSKNLGLRRAAMITCGSSYVNNNFVSRRGLQRCEDTWRYTNTRYTIIIDNKYQKTWPLWDGERRRKVRKRLAKGEFLGTLFSPTLIYSCIDHTGPTDQLTSRNFVGRSSKGKVLNPEEFLVYRYIYIYWYIYILKIPVKHETSKQPVLDSHFKRWPHLTARFWQEKSARDLAECPKPGGESWNCLTHSGLYHFCYIKRRIPKMFSTPRSDLDLKGVKVCQSRFLLADSTSWT